MRAIQAAAVLVLFSAACRQDMHDQPRYTALKPSPFFADGSSARSPVAGTVARGDLRDDELLYTGKQGEEPSTVFPFPIDDAVMERGRERFDIYCSPCHGRTGTGDGIVVQRGFTKPPSLVTDRLVEAPPGHFFEIITNGFGAMPDLASQVKTDDRWAIAAYIRVLQLSAHAALDDVPAAERAQLDRAPGAPR